MEAKRRCARSQGEKLVASDAIIKSSSLSRDQTSHLRTSRSVGSCRQLQYPICGILSVFVLFRIKVDGNYESRNRFLQSAGLI
jgi:hypothetical protein